MTMLLNMFGSVKNMLIGLGATLIAVYIGVLKYKASSAEDAKEKLEGDIAKTNTVVVQETAKAKEEVKDIEHTTEVEVLKESVQETAKVQEEVKVLEKKVRTPKEKKTPVVGRTKGTKTKVQV